METKFVQALMQLGSVLPALSEQETAALHRLLPLVGKNPEQAVVLALTLPVESQGKIGRTLVLMMDALQHTLLKGRRKGGAILDYFDGLKTLGELLTDHAAEHELKWPG